MAFRPILQTPREIVDATERLASDNLYFFDKYGLIDLMEAPVLYSVEKKGDNEYITVEDLLRRGRPYLMDCEDLTGWLLAQLRLAGFTAEVLLEQQTETLFHVVARVWINGNWMRLDPSAWKGM